MPSHGQRRFSGGLLRDRPRCAVRSRLWGLKLAEVCHRLGVTTGSFYHYFTNWPTYTKELVAHWVQERTVLVIQAVRGETDPRRRIDTLIKVALGLPTARRRRSGYGARWIRMCTRCRPWSTGSDSTSCTPRRWRSCRSNGRRRSSPHGRCMCSSVTSSPPCPRPGCIGVDRRTDSRQARQRRVRFGARQ